MGHFLLITLPGIQRAGRTSLGFTMGFFLTKQVEYRGNITIHLTATPTDTLYARSSTFTTIRIGSDLVPRLNGDEYRVKLPPSPSWSPLCISPTATISVWRSVRRAAMPPSRCTFSPGRCRLNWSGKLPASAGVSSCRSLSSRPAGISWSTGRERLPRSRCPVHRLEQQRGSPK